MLTCDACQAQLLEYLYDLLDPAERQALESHLAGCSACAAGLERAHTQQKLLATAARLQFPLVRFQPPAESVAAVLLPVRPRRRLRRVGSLVAAAVLLAVGAPSLKLAHDYRSAHRIVADNETRVAEARIGQRKAAQKIEEVSHDAETRLAKLQHAARDRQFDMVVTGPATVQAGARAEYQIQTTNLNGQPAATRIAAQIMDGDKAVGGPFPVPSVAKGAYRLTLPPDLPIRPGSQMNLVVSAKVDGGSHAELREKIQLASPVYVTHLTTDKPMYQPGETVRFRSLTLNRDSLKPAGEPFRFSYTLTLPTGEQRVILQGSNRLVSAGKAADVLGPDQKPVRGVGAGEFALDAEALGGEYILTVRDEQNRFPEQQRKFIVNRYQKPRLNKELDYSRKTYGPGDEVLATCKAARADGGPVARRPVTASVNIDGQFYDERAEPNGKSFALTTDDKGTALVRFKLPARIDRGLASLSVTFDDGGNVETLVRPVPIVLKKLHVEFFPEGGDLVAGLPNRVYFQVHTTLGKPADLKGRILESGTPLAVDVQTLTDAKEPGVNQGMGKFEFTPRAGARYELQVDSPVGIAEHYALPAVRGDGTVLSVPGGVFQAEEAIRVHVQGSRDRDLMVGLYCRGRLLQSARVPKGQTEATLKPDAGMGGVCRVTVFEELASGGTRRDLKPVAERLIYRQPLERLKLTVHSDRTSYVPGQRATVTLEADNEKGEKTPAIVMVSVVDKSVITLADDKTARAMPTHFLLTTEVRKPEDLEYADFLLTGHPRAAQALDLLLGTQGWRRFAEQDPNKFRQQQHNEEADRLLVAIGQTPVQKADVTEQEFTKVRQEAEAQLTQAEKDYKEAQESEARAMEDPAYAAASLKVADIEKLVSQVRSAGNAIVLCVLPLAIAVFLFRFMRAIGKNFRRTVVSIAGTVACIALFVACFSKQIEERGFLDEEASRHQPLAKAAAENTVAAEKPGERAKVLAFLRGANDAEDEDVARAAGAAPQGRPRQFNPIIGEPLGPNENAGERVPVMLNPRGYFAPGLALRAKGVPKTHVRAQGPAVVGEIRIAPDQGRDAKALALRMNNNMAFKKAAPVPGLNVQGQPQPKDWWPQFNPINGKKLLRRDALPLPPFVIREYAHQVAAGTKSEDRNDFSETLYWHPVLVLDGGKADFSFDLCDSVTSFQVTAYAHTLDGRLGAVTHLLDSRLPLTVQPKVPLEVTAGDRIDIPLSVANNTDGKRAVEVALRAHENLTLIGGSAADAFELPAATTQRRIFRFNPAVKHGLATLAFEAKTAGFAADAVRNSFRIVPEGFPIVAAQSDVLERSSRKVVRLPQTWIPGTLQCELNVYPSTLADLQKGLESLLREPCGCFEQTSTSNYPNLLVLDYLRESDQARPELEKHARELLARGYQMLVSFECPSTPKKAKEGFEWFGGADQAHEALTAYGLLQFRDLARVQEVDPALIQRTRTFLMGQRDGKGGFKRNPRTLDHFGHAPEDVTNAYIVWALTESGPDDDLSAELNALADKARTSKDPYFIALVANSLLNRARRADGMSLLKIVAESQKADGHLDAGSTSITGSGGRDLQIETTALAVLAWLKANNPAEFNQPVQKAVKWIAAQRGGYGGFGSTQSTILALKSLIAFARANKKTPEAGTLKLFVGDRLMGEKAFPAGAAEALTLAVPDADQQLLPGNNNVRLEITGNNVFPYTLGWTYRSLQPASAGACPVRLATKLAREELTEGEVVRLSVKVENAADRGQGMAVAIVGLPGGLIVPEDLKQLKEYTRLPEDGSRPLIASFEIRGRELVLYWRDLAPRQKIEVPIDLICRVPGEYNGPASRAYLYYNADHKHWVEPLKVTVNAKAE